VDEYYWLRDRKDPDVLKFLHEQMDYLEEVMGHTKPLQETLFSELKERIQETDSTVPEKRGKYLYYERTEAGKQYPIFCRREDSPESPEEILLDQNVLAEGQVFCSVSGFAVSPDGSKLAYSVDLEGNEVYTIHIKDLKNGSHFPEVISNTSGSVYVRSGIEWANDNETIFYASLDDAKRPFKFHSHKIGSDPTQDKMIYHEKEEVFSLYFSKSRDDAYIMTHHFSTLTTEVRFLSADQPNGELQVVAAREHGIEYSAEHHKGFFFIATNDNNAKNFKIVKAPVDNPSREHWQEVIPHRTDVLIEDIDCFENYLVIYERKDGLEHIRITDPDGTSNVRYVEFPEPTYHIEPTENNFSEASVLRFKYSSLITPHNTVDYHMDSGEWEVLKEENIFGYHKLEYACELIHATAPDGKQIPISISYKKGMELNGSNPTLLHGYGADGSTLDAEFTPNRILKRANHCHHRLQRGRIQLHWRD
jgi:oligopeptidase B